MKFALNTVKTTIAAVALAAASTAATAATEFNFNDKIVLGYPSVVTQTKDGIGLTVKGFSANGSQAKLDVDFLLGLGVVEYNWIFPELDTRVEGGEYLLFKFTETVTLDNFLLADLPWGSNNFFINGTKVRTDNRIADISGIGASDTFMFASSKDAFRVKSITVSPVPEPEAIAMMLAGLGVVGLVAARRKKAA